MFFAETSLSVIMAIEDGWMLVGRRSARSVELSKMELLAVVFMAFDGHVMVVDVGEILGESLSEVTGGMSACRAQNNVLVGMVGARVEG
jgi:hypothetical protein